ncbi:hypothetical protein [Bacillus taeanensis]|uniref:Uncharacterized protein n=1 Tax=Bacillus taeanensis TaxID=273032 RepID=A0A366XWB9_9BACI|nr:hypothetical protein [Bacillus taeanensis]RBW68241.1 hypothetical protein DS031_17860 [Bacillus taeanensis]
MAIWCAYCRRSTVNIKTIKRPENFVKRFDKYIHVCLFCIKENGLEDIPEYNPNELQKFIDAMQDRAIMPSIISTADGEEFLTFQDGNGYLLSTNKLDLIARELIKTLELDGLDKFVKSKNIDTYLSHHYLSDPENEGKYLIPFDKLNINRKLFNPLKNWSCTCGNCSIKMLSKDGGEYFTINPYWPFEGRTERACSEGCMKVIAKDKVLNWIHEKDYKKYFDLEKLDTRIMQIIKYA